MKKKGIATNALIAVFGIVIVGLFAYMVLAPTPASVTQNEQLQDILNENKLSTYSGYDVEFEVHDLGNAQDAAADIDIDIFEWDPSKNGDLVDDHMVDCSGVTPAMFDGSSTQTDVPQNAFCGINVYKFWSDPNYNAGDSETKLSEHLKIVKADLDDIGGSGTTSYHLNNEKVYLVTIAEGAAADTDDLVPMAFLFEASSETTLDASELENGNINVRFSVDGYADAGANSKLTVSGTYEDSEDNDGTLTSALAGIVDTSLTTATTIDLDGTVAVEVNKNGYALILKNPLFQSNSEKAYVTVSPYGEGTNETAYPSSSAAWEEYGTGDLTGDTAYGNTVQVTNDQIIWAGFDFCGYTITDSSTSDAVKDGDEKIYEPSCWNLEKRNGVWGIWDNNAEIEMDFHIDTVPVDYDAAVNATNAQLDYASGSSPEVFADIDLVGMESTSDLLAQTLG